MSAAVPLLIFTVTLAGADELLQAVDPIKAAKLERFNAAFLQDQLYFSARHRIVQANTDLLLHDGAFTITPFPDVKPARIAHHSANRKADAVHWQGHFEISAELRKFFKSHGLEPPSTVISMHAWDLDESGNAYLSILNRFKHSSYWIVDESDTPRLDVPPTGTIGFAGPAPETPEDMARHQRLSKLTKHAFFDVSATFSLLGGKKYVLMPLRFTPKYSVILELDPEKMYQVQFCHTPGVPDSRSEFDRAAALKYEAFRGSLPDETDRVARGDIDQRTRS